MIDLNHSQKKSAPLQERPFFINQLNNYETLNHL